MGWGRALRPTDEKGGMDGKAKTTNRKGVGWGLEERRKALTHLMRKGTGSKRQHRNEGADKRMDI